jgi:hypothetical protein
MRLLVCAVVGGLFLSSWAASEVLAQKLKVPIDMKWSGSVDDEKLMKDAPEVITSAKTLEKIWQTWKAKGDVPKVDFGKFLVVGVYSRGSKLNMGGATLDEKGNLTVLGFGTRDLQPGFRYVLGTVSKDGVKTVNGKALPKE